MDKKISKKNSVAKDMSNNVTNNKSNTDTPKNSFVINAQYIKDLSFENPKAPGIFFVNKEMELKNSVDVEVIKLNIDENNFNDLENGIDIFEVCIRMHIEVCVKKSNDVEDAKNDTESLFILDIKYAGVIIVEATDDINMLLYVHCPHILFPYLRHLVHVLTANGGYQPIMLPMIDFATIYKQYLVRKEMGKDV